MKRSSYVLVLLLLLPLISSTAAADSDNTINDARTIYDGYDDYWWVCWDDYCDDGPSWDDGIDHYDWYKIEVYPGDKVTWEIYNREEPHDVWLGAKFYNYAGDIINIPADECGSCSDDDEMWIENYETDRITITYNSGSSSGSWAYLRVRAYSGMGGDGTVYDINVDVDTSGRTSSGSSGGSSGGGSECSSGSGCPYRSGYTATCANGVCIYIDISEIGQTQPESQTGSSVPDAQMAKVAVFAAVLVILLITGMVRAVRGRKAKEIQFDDWTQPSHVQSVAPQWDSPSMTQETTFQTQPLPPVQTEQIPQTFGQPEFTPQAHAEPAFIPVMPVVQRSPMDIAREKFPYWDDATIQGYFDGGWSVEQLEEWVIQDQQAVQPVQETIQESIQIDEPAPPASVVEPTPAVVEAEAQSWCCGNCGGWAHVGAGFCVNCGHPRL